MTTDHRAEAEREIDMVTSGKVTDEKGIRDAVTVALMHGFLAIHDELRAILDHLVPTPKEPDEDECCDCHLVAVIERDKAIKERDDLRATVARVEALVGYYGADETQGWHRHAARDLRAALDGAK